MFTGLRFIGAAAERCKGNPCIPTKFPIQRLPAGKKRIDELLRRVKNLSLKEVADIFTIWYQECKPILKEL